MDEIDKLMLLIDTSVNNKELIKLEKEMAKAEKRYKGLTTETKRFDMSMMSLGFGLLFTGMAIKQFTDQAIKGLQTNFMTLADEQSEGVKRIMEMQAAMNFLKFVMVDLFTQSEMFANMVVWFTDMAIRIAEIAEKNPDLVEMAGAFLLMSSVLGTIMMPLGQIALALFAIQTVGLPSIMLVLTVLFMFLIIVSAIVAAVMIWNTKMSLLEKVFWTVVVVIMAIVAAALLLGFSITLPLIVAALVVGVLIASFMAMKDHLGSVGDAFLAFGVFILWVLALVADGIFWLLLTPINNVINAINSAIRLSNLLLGTNWGTIDNVEFSVAKKVDVWRDQLLDRADERKNGSQNSSGSESSNTVELGQTSMDGLAQSIAQYIPLNGSTTQ